MEKTLKVREICNKIWDKANFERPKECRKGQAIFNYTYEIFPEAADLLRGTDFDCFYRDDKSAKFLDEIYKILLFSIVREKWIELKRRSEE